MAALDALTEKDLVRNLLWPVKTTEADFADTPKTLASGEFPNQGISIALRVNRLPGRNILILRTCLTLFTSIDAFLQSASGIHRD
jgi:hypothetical protein